MVVGAVDVARVWQLTFLMCVPVCVCVASVCVVCLCLSQNVEIVDAFSLAVHSEATRNTRRNGRS